MTKTFGQCEKHPTMGGYEVRLRRALDGKALRGFRIVACGECRARMTREGYVVIPVPAKKENPCGLEGCTLPTAHPGKVHSFNNVDHSLDHRNLI